MPWYNHHSSQRSLLSGDRLPNIQLPQSGGTPPSRIGSLDSQYSANNYTPSLTSGSSYTSVEPSLGLKTPSPSGGSPNTTSHAPKDEPAQQVQYPTQAQNSQVYSQESDPYGSAMNQSQPYLDSQHSHLSAGPSYATQSQTAGGMSHYSQYPQQTASLQNGPGAYAPNQSYGGQYYSGVTSPQAAGQPVSTSMGTQLLPLPGGFIVLP